MGIDMNEAEILNSLRSYELNENEAKIYLFLLRRGGEWSVVKLSRELGLGRTPIYNALDKLWQKELIERVLIKGGFNYRAAEPTNLEKWWQRREKEVGQLGTRLVDVVSSLQNLGMPSGYNSRVVYHSGLEGMKQITYNSTKAAGDLYIYEIRESMSAFVPQDEAEKMRARLVENYIMTHQLTNYQKMEPFTRQEEMIRDWWDVRYISPEILAIEFEMLIYNDVVALYSHEESEVFGVEIYNPNLAKMQKQIFSAMQKLAVPLVKLDNFGSARVGVGVEVKGEKEEQRGWVKEDEEKAEEGPKFIGVETEKLSTTTSTSAMPIRLEEKVVEKAVERAMKRPKPEEKKPWTGEEERNEWRKLGLSNMFLKVERDKK